MTMKSIKALGIAMPLALLLGTAPPALAQGGPGPRTFFEDFGCALDTDELVRNGVIATGIFEEGEAIVGFVTEKNCPGSQASPTIQMTCEIALDPDIGVSVSTRNFTCTISGAQCGFNQTFLASNRRLEIRPGLATIRCSRNVN
jgi:hypothetical protein